jgi:ABC-type lipoprotein release transport system permease subunit
MRHHQSGNHQKCHRNLMAEKNVVSVFPIHAERDAWDILMLPPAFAGIGLLAAFLFARKASSLDPVEVLRDE